MEQERPFICLQHNSLIPLQNLPSEYRNEIDRGFSTGWKCLDQYLQGIRGGEITVVTADTGVGKTTFATQLILNCAIQNVPVWVNSWEMKPESMLRKIASLALRRPMKFQEFSEHESEQFDTWCSHYCIYITPNTFGTNIDTLEAHLIIAKDLGIKVVMLDHLDYLVKSSKEKVNEAIEEAMRRLHELALKMDMHFLLICHPRQVSNAGEEVSIHSLKGSSAIKQYADNVIVLHRCSRSDPQADPTKVKVRVAKNRMFGTEGNTYLFYQYNWDGYLELKEGL